MVVSRSVLVAYAAGATLRAFNPSIQCRSMIKRGSTALGPERKYYKSGR